VPVCKNCGRELSEAARFCPTCGTDIPQAQPAPPPDAPESAARLATPVRAIDQNSSNSTNPLPDNIAGMLAYFVLPAVVFLVIRPFNRNRFVRFHSLQCLLTVAALIILQLALALFAKAIPLFILPMYGLLFLAELTLWLLLLFKSYQHEEFVLPVIGRFAQAWANR
jgi:uncharacterized membrane protein